MLRVPMNGQFGISSKVFAWNDALKSRVAHAVALYKRIRPVIRGADVYHLTPPPAPENPTGWMALQYVSPDARRSVLTVYRLAKSQADQTFQLRGLNPRWTYRVAQEGQAQPTARGEALQTGGLGVSLDAVWRAAIIELEAAPPDR